MTRKVIHVALNGVTGRMGYRQHLVRSLLAIRDHPRVRHARDSGERRAGLAQLGLGRARRLTDLWTGRSLDVVGGSYTTTIAPGGVSLISARPGPGHSP